MACGRIRPQAILVGMQIGIPNRRYFGIGTAYRPYRNRNRTRTRTDTDLCQMSPYRNGTDTDFPVNSASLVLTFLSLQNAFQTYLKNQPDML